MWGVPRGRSGSGLVIHPTLYYTLSSSHLEDITVITRGLYTLHGKKVVVAGLSRNTETGERCVLIQDGRPLLLDWSFFLLVPENEYERMSEKDLRLIEAIETPPLFPHKGFGIDPGVYGHFKRPGPNYNVICSALKLNTAEWFVVYQPLYGDRRFELCHRPYEMFVGHVEKPEHNYFGPRFFPLDVRKDPHIAVEYQD